jgi:hypothetical protein
LQVVTSLSPLGQQNIVFTFQDSDIASVLVMSRVQEFGCRGKFRPCRIRFLG